MRLFCSARKQTYVKACHCYSFFLSLFSFFSCDDLRLEEFLDNDDSLHLNDLDGDAILENKYCTVVFGACEAMPA